MKSFKTKKFIFTTTCALLVSTLVSAEEYTPEPELATRFGYNFHRQHDRGLYTRLGAGLGFVSASITPPYQGSEVREGGLRFVYGASLGGYVTPRFVLHLSQWGQVGATRGGLGAGVGQTFYLKESKNIFLSTSVGALTLYDAAPDVGFGEQWALSGEVEAGLGTWVSARSSLGVSLVAGVHVLDLDGDGISGSGWHAGLRLTWALN